MRISERPGKKSLTSDSRLDTLHTFRLPHVYKSIKIHYCEFPTVRVSIVCVINLLAGLVVKASASGAEDPGFESRLRRDFFPVESYQ